MQREMAHLDLPKIPVLDVGPRFGIETLERELDRAHALFDQATHRVPRAVLRSLDGVSRRWLQPSWDHAHLEEIDAIAAKIGRPGAYFLSVNYEWGCTCRVGPSPDAKSARLVRVLDWATPGLGRHLICRAGECSGRPVRGADLARLQRRHPGDGAGPLLGCAQSGADALHDRVVADRLGGKSCARLAHTASDAGVRPA